MKTEWEAEDWAMLLFVGAISSLLVAYSISLVIYALK